MVRLVTARSIALALSVSGLALAAPAIAAKRPAVAVATSWVVDGPRTVTTTTKLSQLVIGANGKLVAPTGKYLTLTVDGVGTAIAPGVYHGAIVVTVTDDIPVKYHDLDPHHYRAALYVDNGRVVGSKSVSSAAVGGSVTNSAADNIIIRSTEPLFNGIVVDGNSKYVINNPVIELTGNGGNDFAGFGAAIMSTGRADVTVNNARIINRGAIRTAIFVGGDSTMRVNNSMIETTNGVLPSDYRFTVEVGRMMEVPWMLGLKGNVRATNLVANGTVYYTNSYIRTQGWGALSTDDARRVRMYVKNSLIETVDSGYGAYSIGDSIDTFSGSVLNVADIGVILAGPGSAVFTDGSVVNSRRFGVMMHSGRGGSLLTIEKGSIFNTQSTAIQIKGRGGTVAVDASFLRANNGILLQAMPNDDPYMKKMMAGGPIVGMQGPGGSTGAPAGPPPGDDGGMSSGSPDVVGTFSNVSLVGDMYNARTAEGDMSLMFKHAVITGALSISTVKPTKGQEPTAETYYLIGDVTNTLGATGDKNGLGVTLDASSQWVVTKTSYLTRLDIQPGAKVTGIDGRSVSMSIDGRTVPVTPGKYTGNIVVTLGR